MQADSAGYPLNKFVFLKSTNSWRNFRAKWNFTVVINIAKLTLSYIINCVKDAVVPDPDLPFKTEALISLAPRVTGCYGNFYIAIHELPSVKGNPLVHVILSPQEQLASSGWWKGTKSLPCFLNLEQLCRTTPDPGLSMGWTKASVATVPQLNFFSLQIPTPLTYWLVLFLRVLPNKPLAQISISGSVSKDLFPKAVILGRFATTKNLNGL